MSVLRPASGRRRTQAERRAESDDRLLGAAAEIVAREGYLALTLERVGERAGFSRGLASRKYGSKDGLVAALIHRAEAVVHREIDAAIAGIADPLDRIAALFDRFFALVLHDEAVRAYFVLFGAVIANRLGPAHVFETVQARFGARLETLVRDGQAAGSVRGDLVVEHAAFMIGSLLAGISSETEMASFNAAPDAAGPLRASLCVMLRRALGT